ncbi:MAG TPA: DUF3300 domain-containing protein, partial [Burkholderiaceae bacterium]|nr:DUF3300 domain-containing protein [Burkholderiaceae bacterium]
MSQSTRWQSCRIAFVLAMLPAVALAQTQPAPAPPPPAAAPAAPAAAPASKEQLEQLLAPIALYPDSLLSQVLMACTYPADVADAAKWVKAHPDNKGDSAVKAVQDQPWDPSVQSLAAFPQILDMMGAQPDWVQKTGDAFLASSKDVLDAVQRLRTKAQQAGNLKSTEQQKVIVEKEPTTQQTIIKVEPAQPETVYVPAYNPSVVYGTWPYPSYPPYYYPPPPYYYPGAALASGIAFGIGVAAIGSIWGGCNWGGGDVNINVNKYNNINSNRQINNSKFEHNSANRRGVPYGDQASRDKYGQGRGGAEGRNDYRGRDSGRDAQRQQAQSSLQNRGMDPAAGRSELRNDPGARDRANQAAQGAGRDRAGAGGGGGASAGSFDRGAAGGAGGDSALRGAGNAG